jgi:drug/metabolite transporter (DMT)-like permease
VTGILLALTASLAWGFSDYVGGVASRSLRVPVVMSLSMLAGCAVVVPVALLSGTPGFEGAEVLWSVVAGVVAVAALGLMFAAMAAGAISIVGPVSACGVAIPVLIGLARGEQPSPPQLAGIVVATVGVVLASIERGADGRPRRLVAGLGLALGSAVCVGLWFVTLDLAATHDPYWASTVSRLTTTAVAVLLAVLWRRRASAVGTAAARSSLRSAPRQLVLLVLVAGLSDAVGEMTFAVSTTFGFISVVSVIASLYPAFMVLLAALFLRERPARHQVVGVAGTLLGIALISAG